LIERRLPDLGLGLFEHEAAIALCPFRCTHNPLTAMAAAATGARKFQRFLYRDRKSDSQGHSVAAPRQNLCAWHR
jgi:hypothetical protein